MVHCGSGELLLWAKERFRTFPVCKGKVIKKDYINSTENKINAFFQGFGQ